MTKTQPEMVLEYLKEHGSITRKKMETMGIAVPTTVISRIRKKGYTIECETEWTKYNPFAFTTRKTTTYTLIKKQEEDE